MKFTKSSWFVAGVVAGAVAIACVVLVINDGALSPKAAKAESQGYIQRQVEHETVNFLYEGTRFFKENKDIDTFLLDAFSFDSQSGEKIVTGNISGLDASVVMQLLKKFILINAPVRY